MIYTFFYLYSDAQYSLKFPARVVPTPLFLPSYVLMTSFSQKLAKFFSFVDFYFIHYHFPYGWTWIFKLGSLNKWNMGNLQMHLLRHMIIKSQCRNKNVTKIVKNYHFEWLSTPTTFVIFNVEPWYYYWRKYMHIRRYCMNLTYFDQHFHTINYIENMTPILQYLSHFTVLLVIQGWVYFNNNVCSHNWRFFKIRNFLKYYEGEKVMMSFWWRHILVNNLKNGPKFVLVL